MKKCFLVFIVTALLLFSVSAWAQFREGLYQFTSQTEIKGMQQQPSTNTFRSCITQNDPVPKNPDKNYDCKTTSFDIKGDTVTYSIECKSREGVMTSSGKQVYYGSGMDGTSITTFKMKGQPEIRMKSKMSGKYLGPCPK